MALFFKNVLLMSSGSFLQILLGFISTAIFVRYIGFIDYAIIGIVFSLLFFVTRLDLPFFRSHMKCNRIHFKNDRNGFDTYFNTIFIFKSVSNIFYVLILFGLAIFLSTYIYQNAQLYLFYTLGILLFAIGRLSSFFKEFLRANGKEAPVTQAIWISLLTGFSITLLLLFYFKVGVLSIFIAGIIGSLIEYMLLLRQVKKLVTFRPLFSKKTLYSAITLFSIHEYISTTANTAAIYGGLFIATFFLDLKVIGIITIFVSIVEKMWSLSDSMWYNLSFRYSDSSQVHTNTENRRIVQEIIDRIGHLFLVGFVLANVLLLLFGEMMYSIYFGSAAAPFYNLFAILLIGFFCFLLYIPFQSYAYILNIKQYSIAQMGAFVLFFVSFALLLKPFGAYGLIISYAVFFIARPLFIFIVFHFNHRWPFRSYYLPKAIALVALHFYFLSVKPSTLVLILIPALFITFVAVQSKKLKRNIHFFVSKMD